MLQPEDVAEMLHIPVIQIPDGLFMVNGAYGEDDVRGLVTFQRMLPSAMDGREEFFTSVRDAYRRNGLWYHDIATRYPLHVPNRPANQQGDPFGFHSLVPGNALIPMLATASHFAASGINRDTDRLFCRLFSTIEGDLPSSWVATQCTAPPGSDDGDSVISIIGAHDHPPAVSGVDDNDIEYADDAEMQGDGVGATEGLST
jgi:hypothetical protein